MTFPEVLLLPGAPTVRALPFRRQRPGHPSGGRPGARKDWGRTSTCHQHALSLRVESPPRPRALLPQSRLSGSLAPWGAAPEGEGAAGFGAQRLTAASATTLLGFSARPRRVAQS